MTYILSKSPGSLIKAGEPVSLRNISIFHSLGFPVMLGSSRKRFIKYISGKNDSNIRLGGTLASSIHAMMNGVQIMRVHDFNEISQGLKVFKSINK